MDEQPVNSDVPAENAISQDPSDEPNGGRQFDSDELFWYDAHFAETEPSERMFTSLQLGRSSPAYECIESPQHHSLDDMSSHCHLHTAKGLTVNGKQADVQDDDDDDDDLDIETMKNKFLSAWTNAKNGW